MSEYRWPVRECLHERSIVSYTIRISTGDIVSRIPLRCIDCGYEFKDE